MTHDCLGATSAEWDAFVRALGPTPLLPVVCNPAASISPQSSLKGLGKVPSKYNALGLVRGFPEWTKLRASPTQVERWARYEDYGICVQCREDGFRALDVDIDDPELSQAVRDLVQLTWGVVPERGRAGSGRFLIPFRCKGRVKRRAHQAAGGAVELLGDGCQFQAAGLHVKSGERYVWSGPLDQVPTVSPRQLRALWEALGGTWEERVGKKKAPRGSQAVLEGEEETAPEDPEPDEVADALERDGLIRGYGRQGQVYFWCPFQEEHSGDSGPTETVYYPPHTGGYRQGHFKCQHAHCAGRTDEEFRQALGVVLGEFDVIDADPVEHKELTDGEAAAAGEEGMPVGLVAVTVEQLLAPVKPARMVLPGVPAQAYTLVAGPLSSYKSTYLDYQLLWKATGEDLLGLSGGEAIEIGVAVRVTYEDTHERIVERIGRIAQSAAAKIRAERGGTAAQRFLDLAAKNMKYLALSGLEGKGLAKKVNGTIVRNKKWLKELVALLKEQAPGGCLVGIDPLRLAIEGSQNDDDGVDVVVRTLNWLSEALGPWGAVIANTHTTKAQALESGSGYAAASYATSGSALLSQHARSNFHLARLTEQEIRKLFPDLGSEVAERQQVAKLTHGRLSHGEERGVVYLLQRGGVLEQITPREAMDAGAVVSEAAPEILAAYDRAHKSWPQVSAEMIISDERLRRKYSRDKLRTIVKTLITNGVLEQHGTGRGAHVQPGKEAARFRGQNENQQFEDVSVANGELKEKVPSARLTSTESRG